MATKMYKAFVKSKETGELTIIESEYTSKKDFARDLRANGYAVKFISTPEKFDEDSENYNRELKRRKNVREAMKQHKASKEQEVETVEQTEVEETAERQTVETTEQAQKQKEVITMKATNYTNKELVEIYKNLKTSAKILGFSSASDSEMIAEIELEAIKRHLNLVDGTVEETAETETAETAEQETTETVEGISEMETTTETDDSKFEYTTSQAQEIIMTGTSIAREKYREKHGIHSPMDLKKFSKKQLDDYLLKEIDYINKFLNDTLPKEVFNAMEITILTA